MAYFTETQAQSSSLSSCHKEFVDGDFSYWVLRVSGSDGQHHQFVDHQLAEDASISDIKARLVGHLTGSDFHLPPTPPVISGSAHYESSAGSKLG